MGGLCGGAIALQDRFARLWGEGLSALLGVAVTARCEGPTTLKAGEFRSGLNEQDCCYTLGAEGWEGGGQKTSGRAVGVWVVLSKAVALAAVEALLGGAGGRRFTPARGLTAVERRLVGKAVDTAAECLSQAWPGGGVRFECAACGASEAIGEDESVVVMSIQTCVAEASGTVRLCLPRGWEGDTGSQAGAAVGSIEATASLEGLRVSAEQIDGLGIGDVLVTDLPVEAEVTVRAGGIAKFVGQLGAAGDKRAVRITGRLNDASE